MIEGDGSGQTGARFKVTVKLSVRVHVGRVDRRQGVGREHCAASKN
jgi:hypothetical protein